MFMLEKSGKVSRYVLLKHCIIDLKKGGGGKRKLWNNSITTNSLMIKFLRSASLQNVSCNKVSTVKVKSTKLTGYCIYIFRKF